MNSFFLRNDILGRFQLTHYMPRGNVGPTGDGRLMARRAIEIDVGGEAPERQTSRAKPRRVQPLVDLGVCVGVYWVDLAGG